MGSGEGRLEGSLIFSDVKGGGNLTKKFYTHLYCLKDIYRTSKLFE